MRTLLQFLLLLLGSCLRLTASDTDRTASSDVTITVLDAANEFPVANAGPDQTITFTNRALLQGKVLDDGITTVAVRTYWLKVSGPGTVTFGFAAHEN